MIDILPPEQSLRGASQASANRNSAAAAAVPLPLAGLASLSMNDRAPTTSPVPNNPPPSYTHSPHPPPPPTPQHNEVAHAVSLYRYSATDPNDLNLEAGDHISVKEYTNVDWWTGINIRTGQEGIFPKNYVRTENFPSSLASPPAPGPGANSGYFGGDSKNAPYGGPPQPPMGGYYQGQQQQQPPPPGPTNPYDSSAPPMGVANQPTDQEGQQGPNKVGEMGKKFGKKLGNAAIFGAGATLGADLVNSIF